MPDRSELAIDGDGPVQDPEDKPELFKSLDASSLENVRVPSQQEIAAAIEQGRRDLQEIMSAPKASRINPKLRFR